MRQQTVMDLCWDDSKRKNSYLEPLIVQVIKKLETLKQLTQMQLTKHQLYSLHVLEQKERFFRNGYT